MTPTTGVLLVGGASSRFGSPKPLAPFSGETLADRAWRILGEAFEARLAVGKGDVELPFPVVVEPSAPQAPLVGVIAGLRAVATETAVFLPVDCPLVTPALLRELGEKSAVTQTGPLPGAYSMRHLPELERRLGTGIGLLVDMQDEIQWEALDKGRVFESFAAIFNNTANVKKEAYFDKMTHFDFKCLLPALLCLDAATGEKLWESRQDFFSKFYFLLMVSAL